MLSRVFCVLLAAGLLSAQAPPASQPQQPPAAETPAQPPGEPIRVQVNEVIVPVTVTDDKGRFVSNLDVKDFKIFDEGREQPIKFFSRERNQPVVVGFLVDQSNASRLHWKSYMMEATIELILTLLPGDKKYNGFLISYANDAELVTNTTNDSDKLIDKIRKMKPGGGAALYDSIYMACTNRALVKGEPIEPRRILIIIGDGHDNASKHTLDEVIELAQRNLFTVFAVSTTGFGFASEGDPVLTRLATETGGRVEYPLQDIYKDVDGYLEKPSDEGNYALKVGTGLYATKVASNMFRAVANVAGEVTTQYIIRYVPDAGDVEPRVYRRIKVDVGLPNVKVRARSGYFPEKP